MRLKSNCRQNKDTAEYESGSSKVQLTTASSLTAARLRFLLKPKEPGWAAAAEAEVLGCNTPSSHYEASSIEQITAS